MVEAYGDLLHRVIRIYILNNMPNRIYFDANINEFFNIAIFRSKRKKWTFLVSKNEKSKNFKNNFFVSDS